MNREVILKRTTSFKDYLLELLSDPESAEHYLEISLENYEKDGDIEMLLLSMRNVVEAQGTIGKLAERALDVLLEFLLGPRMERSAVNEHIDSYTADMLSIEPEDSEIAA